MIAFDKSLRYTTPHKLADIVPPNNQDSFTLDNGRIMINYKPEEITTNIINILPHITGHKLLGKYATYKNDKMNSFNSYEIVPEKFMLSFKTYKEEELKHDIIYYKIELSTDNADKSPSVQRVYINFIV